MQRLKIDMLKFTGAKRFQSKDGTEFIAIPIAPNNGFIANAAVYMDLTLRDNKDGPDRFGYDGFASVDLGQTRREAGEKGPILGNWKHIGQATQAPAPPRQDAHNESKANAYQPQPEEGDDIPF